MYIYVQMKVNDFDAGEYPQDPAQGIKRLFNTQGAMENWGLITGRTTAFLLDPQKADLQAKKYVATTQSHEVAHMWSVRLFPSLEKCKLGHRFGNITTMEWWNYLYLNEGGV